MSRGYICIFTYLLYSLRFFHIQAVFYLEIQTILWFTRQVDDNPTNGPDKSTRKLLVDESTTSPPYKTHEKLHYVYETWIEWNFQNTKKNNKPNECFSMLFCWKIFNFFNPSHLWANVEKFSIWFELKSMRFVAVRPHLCLSITWRHFFRLPQNVVDWFLERAWLEKQYRTSLIVKLLLPSAKHSLSRQTHC